MEDNWVKKFRVLTFSLIFSGALNIGLMAALIVKQDLPMGLEKSSKKTVEHRIGSVAVLQTLSKQSFKELVTQLTNRELIEEGYSQRDLALSALVGFHYFNIEKALSTTELQKRLVALDDHRSIELFPGLSDEQFDAVIRFAYQEKWPLTSKGLFALLQKLPAPQDETLVQAFAVTPEFYALQALFRKSEAPQEPGVLLSLVTEGSWELLDRFAKEQSQLLDLSPEKRRRLLLSYLAHHSPTAAHLLLKTDFAFVTKRLDDRGILDFVSLLATKTEEGEKFCVSLLQSPRGDAVWRAAVEKLYAFAGEPLPEPFDVRTAAARFAPVSTAKPATEAPKPVSKAALRIHTVKEGDSLWKIARQYKVKVDDVVNLNGIQNNKLVPGMKLQIPD
jgi:hypothetical protein